MFFCDFSSIWTCFFSTQVPVFFNGKKLAGLNFNLPGAIWDARLERNAVENLGEDIGMQKYCSQLRDLYASFRKYQSIFINHLSTFDFVFCIFTHVMICYIPKHVKSGRFGPLLFLPSTHVNVGQRNVTSNGGVNLGAKDLRGKMSTSHGREEKDARNKRCTLEVNFVASQNMPEPTVQKIHHS